MSTNLGTRLSPYAGRARIASCLIASLFAGCGGVQYGPSGPPTIAQASAVTALNDIASRTLHAARGQADPLALLGVPARLASLADTAIIKGQVPLPSAPPVLAESGCVRAAVPSALVYDNCMAGDVGLNGQVLLASTEVRYELQIPSNTGDFKGYALEGSLYLDSDRLYGELTLATMSEQLAVYSGGSAATVSVGSPAAKVRVRYDVTPAPGEARIAAGVVEVKVDANGGEQDARYTFAVGREVTVENSLD